MTDDQPDLHRLIGALRGAATTTELAGEDAAVAAMATALADVPADVRIARSPRSLRVVAVVAASLIGVGGIAAAAAATLRPPGGRVELRTVDTVDDSLPATAAPATTTPVTTVPSTTIPVTTVPETTIPVTTIPVTTIPGEAVSGDAGAVPLVDDPTTEFDETQCADGNHGATVGSIAKETPPGPAHGGEVSLAAHSSCGKVIDHVPGKDKPKDNKDKEPPKEKAKDKPKPDPAPEPKPEPKSEPEPKPDPAPAPKPKPKDGGNGKPGD